MKSTTTHEKNVPSTLRDDRKTRGGTRHLRPSTKRLPAFASEEHGLAVSGKDLYASVGNAVANTITVQK